MRPSRGRPRNAAARARIVASGMSLFVTQGYLATTMGQIAAEAEVSVQTIYSAYGSKVGVLTAAHDTALAGDAEPVPLAERPWFAALTQEPTAADAWRKALDQLTPSTVRVTPIYRTMVAAEADAEIAALMQTMRTQRREFSRLLIDRVATRSGLSAGDRRRLADVVYAVQSVETYSLFVIECRWPLSRWDAWVYDTVTQQLEPNQRRPK